MLSVLVALYFKMPGFRRVRSRAAAVKSASPGYARSVGLITVHEIGHLFDLDHDTGDPHSLMKVDGD